VAVVADQHATLFLISLTVYNNFAGPSSRAV